MYKLHPDLAKLFKLPEEFVTERQDIVVYTKLKGKEIRVFAGADPTG